MTVAYLCKWCASDQKGPEYSLHERMFGTGTSHPYDQCAQCGSLQLQQPFPDLALHYPSNYGAHGSIKSHSPPWRLLRRLRTRLTLKWPFDFERGAAQWLQMPWIVYKMRDFLPKDPATRILDVGCGAGHSLLHLSDAGYTSLCGIDPFVEHDLFYPNDIRVRKQTLAAHDGQYDLIMSHHAVEHMPDPNQAIKEMKRLMLPNGVILIWLPVVGGTAWREYGANWVQLDPPRHLCLPTETGFRKLCELHDLSVTEVRYDSTALQFWGSELTRLGEPLIDPSTGRRCKVETKFSRAQFEAWRKYSRELNRTGAGDQALFVIRRLNSTS